MAFQVSPGVATKEIDLTTVIPAVSTSIGAVVGDFRWGPANKVTLVSSEDRLSETFGIPKSSSATDFLVAAQFLAYSSALQVVRVADAATALNANNDGLNNIYVGNSDDVESGLVSLAVGGQIIARYPGTQGNNIKVVILDEGNFDVASVDADIKAASAAFDTAPAAGEYHIAVFDVDGTFSGVANSIVETYAYLSDTAGTKGEDGANIYFVDVINQQSNFIYFGDISLLTAGVTTLSGGVDGTVSDAEKTAGWDLFRSETVDVSLLIAGAVSSTVANYIVSNVAEFRKDCVVTISPERDDVVGSTDPLGDVLEFRDALGLNTSYAFLDSNWKYIYNKYFDRFEWVPLSGDTAGLMARTDFDRDAWFSPAGYNRGILKNVVRLAWNPERTDRDELYKLGVNPVISEPGQGALLFGDKTLLSRPSAFDRINVRRLFIVLEKAIATAAKFQLFELNDQFTRAQFVSIVEPFLREVQGRRGVTEFKVVCDETNNTPQVVDTNRFIGDIYIKPARSINFITLNFVAVRSGADFNEVVGQF
jgi:phage tail sheath protein FI